MCCQNFLHTSESYKSAKKNLGWQSRLCYHQAHFPFKSRQVWTVYNQHHPPAFFYLDFAKKNLPALVRFLVSFYCTTLTRMQLRLIWTLNGAACQFIKVWKVPFSSIFHLDIEIFPPLTSVKCMFGKYKKIFSIRSISNLTRFLKQCQTTANRTLPFICKDSFVCSQDVFLFFIKTINKFWYESFLLYLSPSHA